MTVVLGIDLGTSGLKLAAVGDDGAVVAAAEVPVPAATVARPGWAEADPGVWLAALGEAVARLGQQLGDRPVAAAGIAGQMHGLVLADGAGGACRDAVLWLDRRAGQELAAWRRLPASRRAALANPLVPGMTGPVLAWLSRHEPAAVAAAEVLLLPKDYLRRQLAGPPVTDRSDASGTLLWDVPGDAWAYDVAESLDLPARLLPEVRESSALVGEARPVGALAALDGLVPGGGLPVVTGAADTPAALLACGGLAPGEVQVNLGSGAQVLQGLPGPDTPRGTPAGSDVAGGGEQAPGDPVVHRYADAEDGWYAMAAVRNAGLALDQVVSWLGLTRAEAVDLAAGVPADAAGVSFVPFLSGERGGLAGPASTAAWLGLDERAGRAELLRSATDAVAFAVRRAIDLLPAPADRVRLTGGGARHPVVRDTLRSLLDVPVSVVPARSASALGAAALAARGVGRRLPVLLPVAPLEEPPDGRGQAAAAYERWLRRLPAADL